VSDDSYFDQLLGEPSRFGAMSSEDQFGIDPRELAQVQLRGIQQRFEEMRPKVNVLERLSEDLDITKIERAEDVTALCFPHTMYKSFAVSYIEDGRFDRMTRWLSTLTTVDLSGVDATGCDSLESWLNLLEARTTLRPLCSSGTTGKISVFPKGEIEEMTRFNNQLVIHGPWPGEPDSRLAGGKLDFFCPWPVSTGRHNFPNNFKMLRKHLYGGDDSRVHVLGDAHWDIDVLWLAGRIRAAEAKGQLSELRLNPKMQALRDRLTQQQAAGKDNIDKFLHELLVEYAERPVFLFAPFNLLIPLAQEAKKRGMKAKFSPDSYVLGGGRSGSKGMIFPDDWMEQIMEIFPAEYQQVFGMTEMTVACRRCTAGHHFHLPPNIVPFLIDPDTSQPLPRTGVQTGRYAFYDLYAQTHWGGIITGDRLTINFDGGCACGRTGPYVHEDIERYSNLRDDDKITCAKSPEAYEKAVELTLGAIHE